MARIKHAQENDITHFYMLTIDKVTACCRAGAAPGRPGSARKARRVHVCAWGCQ